MHTYPSAGAAFRGTMIVRFAPGTLCSPRYIELVFVVTSIVFLEQQLLVKLDL